MSSSTSSLMFSDKKSSSSSSMTTKDEQLERLRAINNNNNNNRNSRKFCKKSLAALAKKTKMPQRGMGIAQLERLRAMENMRTDTHLPDPLQHPVLYPGQSVYVPSVFAKGNLFGAPINVGNNYYGGGVPVDQGQSQGQGQGRLDSMDRGLYVPTRLESSTNLELELPSFPKTRTPFAPDQITNGGHGFEKSQIQDTEMYNNGQFQGNRQVFNGEFNGYYSPNMNISITPAAQNDTDEEEDAVVVVPSLLPLHEHKRRPTLEYFEFFPIAQSSGDDEASPSEAMDLDDDDDNNDDDEDDDEDTGAQIAPIIKLEEVAVSTGEENEDALLDLLTLPRRSIKVRHNLINISVRLIGGGN
ncbi:hypothetical protein ACFE04_022404 [Oxalis oulophora]